MRWIDVVTEGKARKTTSAQRLTAWAQKIGVNALMAWGETIGVFTSVSEKPDWIDLAEIERGENVPKGRGADFMRALCAYADARQKPVYLATVGWNDTLPNYYRKFGFVNQERDEETGDLTMVRHPRDAMKEAVSTGAARLSEASPSPLWQRGYEDGLNKGEADFEFLGIGRPNEEDYWQGFDYGKSQRPQPAKPTRMPRIQVPANLHGISPDDLNAAYAALLKGHATDNVRNTQSRSSREAVAAIQQALRRLSDQFQDGTIRLYRTIEVRNPEKWVAKNMTTTRSLGIYWSSNENYVMQHAENECVLFAVDAPVAAIDWPDTILLTIDGVEDEVRLRPGAAITLSYVEPQDWEFTPEPQQTA